MDLLFGPSVPRFELATLSGIFQQLGVGWVMYRYSRRAHLILVLDRWWPILSYLIISLIFMPILLQSLLLLQLVYSMFIFTSMYICGCTCYRFNGGVTWRLQARPISSWRMWSTALLYFPLSVHYPKWSVLSHCGWFPFVWYITFCPHRVWLPIMRLRNSPHWCWCLIWRSQFLLALYPHRGWLPIRHLKISPHWCWWPICCPQLLFAIYPHWGWLPI